ncbi:MAG TPA: Hsp20/alpha crystallin family protein [Anaerolineales bacterium]|nr:Hsp20/alpha crystallin family protein [Anaerolineales bacterium]
MNTSDTVNDLLGFDPSIELSAFRDALGQLFNEGWTSPRDVPVAVLASTIVPIDILDTGAALEIRANMPGVKMDHLSITLKGDTLLLKGEVTPPSEEENASFLRHERRALAYTRSLTLPQPVDADHAEAHLRSGVLTLSLPKSASSLPKTIKVTASDVEPAKRAARKTNRHA